MAGVFTTTGYLYSHEPVYYCLADVLLFGLPYGAKVTIDRDLETDTAQVWLFCPIWMNKSQKIGLDYSSSEFSDREIVNDVAEQVLSKFDKTLHRLIRPGW